MSVKGEVFRIHRNNRCVRCTALSDHFRRRLDGRDFSVGGLIRARSSADIQDSFCRSQRPSDHHPNPRVGFPEIRIIDPDRIVGSTNRLPHVSTIHLDETPQRLAPMPRRGMKTVLWSGLYRSPPSATADKNTSHQAPAPPP